MPAGMTTVSPGPTLFFSGPSTQALRPRSLPPLFGRRMDVRPRRHQRELAHEELNLKHLTLGVTGRFRRRTSRPFAGSR
jgi:hypothetical protein